MKPSLSWTVDWLDSEQDTDTIHLNSVQRILVGFGKTNLNKIFLNQDL